jgi:hypothetical protein
MKQKTSASHKHSTKKKKKSEKDSALIRRTRNRQPQRKLQDPQVKKQGRWFVFAAVIAVLVALCIRAPFFARIPFGLNRDEAGLGYNAFSLLKTGKDEYGKTWPVSITSFGDQKLPGYVYTLIPFIAVFHLNTFAIRLPSFLSGLAVIVEMGVVTKFLAESLRLPKKGVIVCSFLAMLFIAVSPWANHFSRVAYEAHLALACFIFGFLMYKQALHALEKKNVLRQRVFLVSAALAWSTTLLTYHSYQIFTPLMIFALLVFDFSNIKKMDKFGVFAAWGIGCATIAMLFFGGVIAANQVKQQGISPFHKADLEAKAKEFRDVTPGVNALYERALFNPATEGIVVFSQNVVSIFSGNFFFVHGSNHGDHNPGNMNNFQLFLIPLLLFGILELWKQRQNPDVIRMGFWLLLGMVAPALTIQPQHEIRLSPIFPLLEVGGAFGAAMLYLQLDRIKKHTRAIKYGVLTCFFLIFTLGTLRSFLQYLYVIPSQIESNEKYHLLGRALARYQTQGLPIITQSPSSSPYIWYLLESQFDPHTFQTQAEHYPADAEGFLHVKKIGNISFETIQWDDLHRHAKIQPLILIFQPKEVPVEVRYSSQMQLLETISGQNGEVDYEVWKLNG